MATLVVDTGPLYAAMDRRDAAHRACADLLETWSGPLVVPVLVVTEVCYLAERRLGAAAEVALLGDLADGSLVPEPVATGDWVRIASLVARYANLPLGTVDASVVTAAERLDVPAVATLDRRHFSVVRPAHVDTFQLLP